MSARVGDNGKSPAICVAEGFVEPSAVDKLVSGLFKSQRPRTYQEVRRNSPHAGEREERIWRQFNLFGRDDNNAIMRAAEHIEHQTKRPGRRNGAIGYVGLAVLRYLLRLRSRIDGRLDPQLKTIAQQVRHSRSAVCKALMRLKLAGFLGWLRRSVPVDDPEPDGQYVKQTSNAFFFEFRKDVEKLICRLRRRPTAKAAAAAAEADRHARSAAMTPQENIAAIVDPDMRATLTRMSQSYKGENLPDGRNGKTL